ncbi:hypothetical protein O181_005956 [Austropuccinia psidii MF-1]|uniref:Reverse transcriptase domain-containing protein n=1 Tax=Austropuccinia psidii MF-1 TaxID=1389203 RepID=A0A9Q3GGC1_9BASI|nr:hypothetical protein [Austropuccinia psidii MF-1]
MSFSEKEALKQLPEASSFPKFSGTGEYDHMELIDYIDGLFIDLPSIPYYWITARLNTEFKVHASIWSIEMKEIHGRRNWPWWKSKIIQNYRNDDNENTLQYVRKRTDIGKYTPYRSSGFKQKQPFIVQFKDKPRERVAEVTKKKNSCHNFGSTDHYTNNCPKAKKKVYAIEKVPDEEFPTEDSESDSMGDSIREQLDEEKDPREEFLVQYQEETPLEIQHIQLEAGMPQDTANKNLCKHTQDAQKFLVTPTKWGTLLHSGQKLSENYFPKWEKQLLQTKEKNFKIVSGKMNSILPIIKQIIITHRKGNIRLNLDFVVLDDAHIQGLLLEPDCQRMHGIDIYNSKNRHITIGTNKEKKLSLDLYQISAQDLLEELLNEFREGQFSITLTSKQKLSMLKMLRKNRPAFAIGEEPLGKIRGHDIELYLDVERPYPPMLSRPPYPANLETRKEIEKHINELLDMDVIRKIGHNKIVGITTPFQITWNDGKSRLCGDFRVLNNYAKADRYPIPRIPHALDKLAKAKYITKMDCMKNFHQNGVEPNSMKFLRIICHMGIYEYTRMPFGTKNAPAHSQRMVDNIFQEILELWMVVYIDYIIIYSETWEDHVQYIDKVLSKCIPINLKILLKKCNFGQQELLALGNGISGLSLAIDENKVAAVLQKPVPRNIKERQSFLGFSSYYRNHIKNFAHIASSLYKLCSKDSVFDITKERGNPYERIKHELKNAPVLILPDFELPFKFFIYAACSQGLGEALHQRQISDGEPREGVICYISRQLKDSESRYGATHTEFLF